MKVRFLFAAACLAVSVQALAGNALPSCYAYAGVTAPGKPVATELFVLVDQTTSLDSSLKQMVADNIRPFLKPGNAISILQYSAFTQGHYTRVLTSYQLDDRLDNAARNEVSKPALAKLDQCAKVQLQQAGQLAGTALRTAFDGASSTIAKSDILASFKDMAGKVRQSVAQRKVVLIASDMLENSSLSSFYSKQAVRKIDPAVELGMVQRHQLFADFGGARVYVLGAGLLAADAGLPKGVYRDPKTLQLLQSFWLAYFQKSNAQLVEFGQPALLNPVQ